MTGQDTDGRVEPPALPDDAAWRTLGIVVERELDGGHQARVLAAHHEVGPLVVKLTDARLADDQLTARMRLLERLAASDDRIVGPIRVTSDPVVPLGDWLVTCFPMVDGERPDVDDANDVGRMAETLAGLHRTFERVGDHGVGPVAPLRRMGSTPGDAAIRTTGLGDPGGHQLLHGDYSAANLFVTTDGLRVIDFDDCGTGPVEFELGNTLYMELFDAATSQRMPRYEAFRDRFLGAYRAAADRPVSDELVATSIGVRIRALARWLDDPDTAPIGIRTAAPAWRELLRTFVRSQAPRHPVT